jgi:hypothetical protein
MATAATSRMVNTTAKPAQEAEPSLRDGFFIGARWQKRFILKQQTVPLGKPRRRVEHF